VTDTVAPATAPTTCALLSRTHGASLPGTAPVAAGWVLVEQPGAWGRDALRSSGLDPALGDALDRAAGDDVRVQLVRRPGAPRQAPIDGRRTVVLAHAGRTPWAERVLVDDDRELAGLDPRAAAAPSPPGLGEPVDAPLWLVCTHGKRDRCCATYGRPIVDALAALHGRAVWEVSHVGGHRFAGNLVALPDGLVYGALQVAEALRAVDLHGAGRLDLAHARGRSGQPRPAQAAELLVRRELDVDRHDAVTVEEVSVERDTARVRLTVDGRTHDARVRKVATGARYAQSCDAGDDEDPGRFELVELTAR
jgi:hypothetical protein